MQGVCWDLDGLCVLLICLIASNLYIGMLGTWNIYRVKFYMSGLGLMYCCEYSFCRVMLWLNRLWLWLIWVQKLHAFVVGGGTWVLAGCGTWSHEKDHDAWLCRHTFGTSYIDTLTLLISSVKSSNVSLDLMWILYSIWVVKITDAEKIEEQLVWRWRIHINRLLYGYAWIVILQV